MGLYRDSIEQLNAEYKDRTSISVFGRHATMLRLLVDSYEVRLRFERLLEEMKKGPMLFEDADLDYMEWADQKKWEKPMYGNMQKRESVSQTAKTFGFSEESPFAQTYANRIQDALGEYLNKIDADHFRQIVSSVVITDDVISDIEFDLAIEENIRQLRNTLVEIKRFKDGQRWSKKEYAQFYVQLYDEFLRNILGHPEAKKEHQKWLRDNLGEPDYAEYEQRRRELLLEAFQKGFLDVLKNRIHVPSEDDLKFSVIKDEELMPNLTDTLKWYAAFKKLFPKDKDGFFRLDEYAILGQYIYDNNISKIGCWCFWITIAKIELVQQEMFWLQHPEERPHEDETLEKFVERVTQIMLKAEDRNGEIIEYKDNKNNKCQFKFNVDGKGFCAVMDEVLENHADLIEDYLERKMGDTAIGVTKVCPFIGCVVGLHIFNDEKVRNLDFEPAFQFVYGEKNEKGKKRSFIQKMSATQDIKDKAIFEVIKTIRERKKNELLEEKN